MYVKTESTGKNRTAEADGQYLKQNKKRGSDLEDKIKFLDVETGEEIDFADANVSILGFQDNAKETNVTFEFDDFYIQECIKDDVYNCGLYYSDGGFTDLTDEVSDIIKRKGRKK